MIRLAFPFNPFASVLALIATLAGAILLGAIASRLLGIRQSWARTFIVGFLGFGTGVAFSLTLGAQNINSFAHPFVFTASILVSIMLYSVAYELLARARVDNAGRRRSVRMTNPLRSVSRLLGRWARYLQITSIVARHGLSPYIRSRRELAPAGAASDTRSARRLWRRVRGAMEEAGGTFVKLGQVLSTRPDLLLSDAIAEFASLQDRVLPAPAGAVEALLAGELGAAPAEIFAEFDREPLAAASIAQVYRARLASGVLAGAYAVMLLNVGGQYAKAHRVLEHLAQGSIPTTLAPTLPNPALALPAGTSITLGYQQQSSNLAKVMLVYSSRLLISTFCFEMVLLLFTPNIVPLFLGVIAGVPLVVQWLLLGLPPILWVMLSLHMLRATLRTSIQTLTIDDRGITRRRPWGQDEQIGWQDITRCVRMLFFTGDQVLGSYLVYSPEHYLEITLYPLRVLTGHDKADSYRFTPDPANYRAIAEQALATILARSGVPLQAVSTTYYSKGGRYTSYTLGVAAQDVALQPEAPLAYQPSSYALDWARSYSGAYRLPVRQNFLMVHPSTRSAALLKRRLAGGLALILVAGASFLLLLPDLGVASVLPIALIALLPGFLLLALAIRQATPRQVEIVADA